MTYNQVNANTCRTWNCSRRNVLLFRAYDYQVMGDQMSSCYWFF